MKLRNNNTREIKAVNHSIILVHFSDGTTDAFHSVKELTDKYSDYTEPLIKDEKIRKALRAWAEANDIRYARKCGSLNAYTRRLVGFDALGTGYTIEFEKYLKLYGDPDKIEKDSYTIAELCGEEEEE